MTIFQDGPAKGQSLMLKRAPVFLRVVKSLAGKWDGLDQLDDRPQFSEEVFAYVMTRPPGHMHIRAKGGAGGFYPVAEYQLCTTQPTDFQLRNNSAWGEWANSQPPPGFVIPI